MTPRAPATLMVVGDVHRFWRAFDADFLARENPALTMFVGDLGDEDVEITRTLAALTLPKVVMLGNHDAWQSFQKRKATPKLREILAVLGTDHLAYEVREVPEAGISVIGARPFSWGGPSLRSPELYEEPDAVADGGHRQREAESAQTSGRGVLHQGDDLHGQNPDQADDVVLLAPGETGHGVRHRDGQRQGEPAA